MSAQMTVKPPKPLGPRLKVAAGVVVGVAILLWLVLFLTVGGDFYSTVEEANAAGTLSNSRVGGTVAVDSVVREGERTRFVLEGKDGGVLDVYFTGPAPERLRAHEEVVVSGSLAADGTFEATEVLVKCPDALFPEKVTNSVLSGTGLERLLY